MQKIEKLEWDSEFFGFPVFKIDLDSQNKEELIPENLSNGAFYYIFSKEKIEGYNDFLKDEKVVYQKEVLENRMEEEIPEYSDESNEELLNLAIQSGEFSRFRMDSDLNSRFEKMYKIWLERSLDKSIADAVFVYKRYDRVLGFVTFKIQNNCGLIGLIAVDETSRGMGVGSKLINQVEFYLSKKGIRLLKVPTQKANINACRFYEKYGFQTESLTYIYHINKL